MLHAFLRTHRAELTARCQAKVSKRTSTTSTAAELGRGVPVLIDQLIEMLGAEHLDPTLGTASVLPFGSDTMNADIDRAAAQHGNELLRKGFTVDQVVHDYGDLCQAVTELAQEKNEPISVDEFHTFNRCLDIAIAGAVTEFDRQRDSQRDHVHLEESARTVNERLGALAHELRNLLNTALLAYTAIKGGHGAVAGATGAVLDRSLEGLRSLVDRALADVRLSAGLQTRRDVVALDVVLEEVRIAAQLDASARGVGFSASVETGLSIATDREMLSSAIANLLQNAFKFTRAGGSVSLTARAVVDHLRIEVADQCGGLPPGWAEELFLPFTQRGSDRSGVGLGLSISRRAVQAIGGSLEVRDVPGTGCVFTVDLPLS
jgi:signal transduction histidine kinase